jgi:hypothetical protein
VLYPPDAYGAPRAAVHFIGGGFVGAAPQLAYRPLLEALAARGALASTPPRAAAARLPARREERPGCCLPFLDRPRPRLCLCMQVIATPFSTSFDHLREADGAYFRLQRALKALGPAAQALPTYGVGHSLGALLHLLIDSRYVVSCSPGGGGWQGSVCGWVGGWVGRGKQGRRPPAARHPPTRCWPSRAHDRQTGRRTRGRQAGVATACSPAPARLPQVQRAGNILMSFNNKPATETVPLLSEVLAPSARALGPVLRQLATSPLRSGMEQWVDLLKGKQERECGRERGSRRLVGGTLPRGAGERVWYIHSRAPKGSRAVREAPPARCESSGLQGPWSQAASRPRAVCRHEPVCGAAGHPRPGAAGSHLPGPVPGHAGFHAVARGVAVHRTAGCVRSPPPPLGPHQPCAHPSTRGACRPACQPPPDPLPPDPTRVRRVRCAPQPAPALCGRHNRRNRGARVDAAVVCSGQHAGAHGQDVARGPRPAAHAGTLRRGAAAAGQGRAWAAGSCVHGWGPVGSWQCSAASLPGVHFSRGNLWPCAGPEPHQP